MIDRTRPQAMVDPPRFGPADRPSLAFRSGIGLLAVAAMLFNVALLLSDRAPGFTRRVFGGFAARLSARLNANARAEVLRDGGLPESDAIVHIGVWAVATLLVAMTLWTWRGLFLTAIAVFASSVVIELAQGRFSTTRDVELNDVLANGVGVCVGAVVAASAFVVWSGFSGVVRGIRQPRR